MKSLIFKIRYWLMPSELKSGTWLLNNGNASNMSNWWRKTKKKGYWKLPDVVYDEKGKLYFSIELELVKKKGGDLNAR